MIKILGFLLFAATSSFASGAFNIAPFVYLKDKTLELVWQRPGEPVFHQALPYQTCGLQQKISYFVPGMMKPAQLTNVPCPEDQQPVRFSFLADTQSGLQTDAIFMDLVARIDTQAIIFGGDMVEHAGTEREWTDFFDVVNRIGGEKLIIPVMGNHEYRHDKEAVNFQKYFNKNATEAFNSVWLGPVHLMILNSSFEDDPSLIIRQILWLQNELKKPAAWKVVTFHHPPFSRSVMQAPTYPKKEYRVLRDLYLPMFEMYGVDVVLNGHTHFYEHSYFNGIHYLTTGAAGGGMGIVGTINSKEIFYSYTRTFIQVQASGEEFFADVIALNGNTVDRLHLKKISKLLN